jgi:GTP-dependent phosphoenolpyruvate carboxykinase
MNEFDWIPTPIRDVLRDGINYKIVPAMKNNLSRWWNGLSQTEKDRLINQISRYADEIEREINSATITARVTSPTP